MLKKILKIKLLFITLIIVLFISATNFCLFYLFAPGPLTENKIIIIEPKLSIEQISTKLSYDKIVKYPKLFELLAKIYSFQKTLKSGEYIFTSHISPVQVLRILANGKSIIHKMIVPEGSIVNEIISKINDEQRLLGEIKGIIPEGFLMPSTYFYSYGDQKEQLIDQMRKLMSANLDLVMKKLSSNSPIKTRLQLLTLASIVEKEAQLDEERPIIAAVFLNRLKKNMKLQADPTTIYAITQGKYKLERKLTKNDLLIQSPYNTYYSSSLPPMPIACPGLKSLEAVVNPANSGALYFVVNGKGGHNFSVNYVDHVNHIKSYKDSVKASKPIILSE